MVGVRAAGRGRLARVQALTGTPSNPKGKTKTARQSMKAQRSTRPLLPAQRCRNCSYIRPSPSFSHSPYSNFQEIKRAGLPVRTHPPLHHASPPQTLNPLPHPSESHKSAPIAGNESQRFTSDKLSHLLFSVFILNFLTLISSPLPPKH